MKSIAIFLVGVAAGIAWYKFYIIYTIDRITNTACDYCQFQINKNALKKGFFHQKKK